MPKFKENVKFYFSVEGETEKWYLKWLEKAINSSDEAKKTVTVKCDVQKDPVKFVKKLTVLGKTEVYHLSDYESDEPEHVQQFITAMDRMKEAKKYKQVKYSFGYTNLTFDLWIILHKINCNGHIVHRKHYIQHINRAYEESFQNMDAYKHKADFKRCLGKLELQNVIEAINRATEIMKRNEENGYTLHQYKGFKYYKENPSLGIWEAIEKVFKECELI